MHRIGCAVFYLWTLFSVGTLPAQPELRQNLNIRLENTPLPEALLEISAAAGIDITFSPRFFSSDQRVSLIADNQSLEQVLDQCLANTGISYRYTNRRITLFRRSYSVSGYVIDASNGEPLTGANIALPDQRTGTYTNSYGYFHLELPRGEYRFQISYLGYQAGSLSLFLTESRRLKLRLEPVLTLREVVVTSNRSTPPSLRNTQVPLPSLQSMPLPAGEPDLFRSLAFFPGVQSGADGLGGLSVRGGDNGQNLVLMDDVPIYHPTHSLGVLSIFNPELVRDVRFHKDGFPARYSGRLSSVLDVRNREGNNQRISGMLGLSTVASQLRLEVPIQKKGGLLLAGRRTHIDPLLNRWSTRQKEENGQSGSRNYAFYDLNLKSWYPIGKSDKLHLSVYVGGDRFFDQTLEERASASDGGPLPGFDRYTEDEVEYTWGNRLTSLRWNHLFGERLFSNLTLIHSRFSYVNEVAYRSETSYAGTPVLAEEQTARFQSDIGKEALRLDFDYFGGNHHLQFGGHLAQLRYTPGIAGRRQLVRQLDSLIAPPTESRDTVLLRTLESGLYAEDRIRWKKWEMVAGVHLSALCTEKTTFWAWQPRVRLFFRFTENWDLHFSGSRTVQFLHLLSAANAGLPSDLWVPASELMPPQYSWQGAIGCTGIIFEDWEIQTDLYWKQFRDIPQIRRGLINTETSIAIDAGNWEDIAFQTDGKAYGLEFLLRRQAGSLRPWLAYTWSRTTRQIGSLQLPVPFDYRHRIVAALSWLPGPNWQLSASWHYFSAAPLSPVLEEEEQLSFLPFLPATDLPSGQSRMPDYHRLDIRATYIRKGKILHQEFSIGAYNLYNRTNGLFLKEQNRAGADASLPLRQINGLPFLPSLRYQLSF